MYLSIQNPQNPFEELCKLLYDTYLITDPGVIKLIAAVVIAHRLPADPVWLFLVAGSSGGKTEFLNALTDVPSMHPLDSITANTFLSGQQRQGKETSLLHRIKNGIITLKDFTTILSMQRDVRGEIMGQLRKIYDGEFSKSFGTGEDKTWRGKITMLAGVTTSIYTMGDMYAAMGERFIMYKILMPDPEDVARRAIFNANKIDMKERRMEIRTAFSKYIESVTIPDKIPELPDELMEEIISLSNMATLARSAVERDYRSQSKEITFVHDREAPTRFATQLATIASSIITMNEGGITQEDKNILYKITLDSIHKTRRQVLQELTKYKSAYTKEMSVKLNLPSASVRRYLEDLNALGMVDMTASSGGNKGDMWILKDKFREVMSRFDGIQMLEVGLEEEQVELTQEDLDAVASTLGIAEDDDNMPLREDPDLLDPLPMF